jgi:hypothetical protein
MLYRFGSHHRFPVSLPLTYARGFREGQGRVWNLSVIGWRISGDLLVQRDAVCELRVTLPTREQVTVSAGIVRWVRGAECGIETLVMSTQAAAQLGDYIRVRAHAL